jgi:hypothetical protein
MSIAEFQNERKRDRYNETEWRFSEKATVAANDRDRETNRMNKSRREK